MFIHSPLLDVWAVSLCWELIEAHLKASATIDGRIVGLSCYKYLGDFNCTLSGAVFRDNLIFFYMFLANDRTNR